MFSVYNDVGFLPKPDPLSQLPAEYASLDAVASDLPILIASRKFRQLAKKLPEFDFEDVQEHDLVERLMLVYSYFASAYVWGSSDDKPEKVIPRTLASPLVQLAEKCERMPILSYASYCLCNWRRKDKEKPIELGNIELLQNFVDVYDEDWFILVHVDIEAKGGAAINAIMDARGATYRNENESLHQALIALGKAISAVNKTLDRMPEQCSPDVYFNCVRPYIFSFEDVIYEGCFDGKPQTYRGETGAQSSLLPAIQSVLGITHTDSVLTQHLDDMRNYMPGVHRRFVAELDKAVKPYGKSPGISLSKFDIRQRVIDSSDAKMRDAYNECINQFWKFRDKHFDYAVEYIHKKVTGPKGTGGTPFMQWLKQLRDETSDFLLESKND